MLPRFFSNYPDKLFSPVIEKLKGNGHSSVRKLKACGFYASFFYFNPRLNWHVINLWIAEGRDWAAV